MLTKALILVSLLSLAAAQHTPPTTHCITIGTDHPLHTRTSTRTSDCTNYFTRYRTVDTSFQPVTTSTVYGTSTITAPTVTDTGTATSIITVTNTQTTTNTYTTTSTSTITSTTSITYNTAAPTKRNAAPPVERELPASALKKPTRRPSPEPGVNCVVTRCVKSTVHSISTSTNTLPLSTATATSTVRVTVTPNASTTITVNNTITSTSTLTASTTLTQNATSTLLTTYTPTATFYIASSGDPNIPDGTTLYASSYGEDDTSFFFNGFSATLFVLDPSTGLLTFASNGEIANSGPYYPDDMYFNGADTAYDYDVCDCSLDPQTLALSCYCAGYGAFLETDTRWYVGSLGASGYDTVYPVVQIVDQN